MQQEFSGGFLNEAKGGGWVWSRPLWLLRRTLGVGQGKAASPSSRCGGPGLEHAEVRSVGYLGKNPRLLEPDLRGQSPGRR